MLYQDDSILEYIGRVPYLDWEVPIWSKKEPIVDTAELCNSRAVALQRS